MLALYGLASNEGSVYMGRRAKKAQVIWDWRATKAQAIWVGEQPRLMLYGLYLDL